jgi:hypothetical protein
MSKVVSRRESLKLASAAAALGAGLGVVLGSREADAQTPPKLQPSGAKIPIDAVTQHKIDTYLAEKPQKGYVQWKWGTSAGQELFATMIPESIAEVLAKAPGGTLQFKFYRPAPAGHGAPQVFRSGVMQIAPGGPAPAPAPAPPPPNATPVPRKG